MIKGLEKRNWTRLGTSLDGMQVSALALVMEKELTPGGDKLKLDIDVMDGDGKPNLFVKTDGYILTTDDLQKLINISRVLDAMG